MPTLFPLNHKLLPEDETRRLILAHRAGDQSATERLLAHNERLILRMSLRYHSTGSSGDTPIDDLMQWGRLGLLRALEDFDLDSGNRFSTYVFYWIRQAISRYGKQEGRSVGLSYKAREDLGRIGKIKSNLIQQLGRQPTVAELAAAAEVTEGRITELNPVVMSLDNPVNDSEHSSTMGEFMPAEDDTEADAEHNLTMWQVHQSVDKLPERYKQLIVWTYGLDGCHPATQHQIARRMGITKQRVSQLQQSAIACLRHELVSK